MARRDGREALNETSESHGPAEGDEPQGPLEIAIVGDLTEHEGDFTDRLLGVELGGACTIYFDSPGGSPYCAMSLVGLLKLRDLDATAVVTGECSSAALWPFAACRRRLVTSYSVFLFHPMKWQSEEHIGMREAAEWSRHFAELEQEMDVLLAELFGHEPQLINEWIATHRYVSGRELAAAGLAELIPLAPLPHLREPHRQVLHPADTQAATHGRSARNGPGA
jgi:ATP-dependent Clp protease protease subunit